MITDNYFGEDVSVNVETAAQLRVVNPHGKVISRVHPGTRINVVQGGGVVNPE